MAPFWRHFQTLRKLIKIRALFVLFWLDCWFLNILRNVQPANCQIASFLGPGNSKEQIKSRFYKHTQVHWEKETRLLHQIVSDESWLIVIICSPGTVRLGSAENGQGLLLLLLLCLLPALPCLLHRAWCQWGLADKQNQHQSQKIFRRTVSDTTWYFTKFCTFWAKRLAVVFVVPGNAERGQAVSSCARVELLGTIKKGAESSAKLLGFRGEPLWLGADCVAVILLSNTLAVWRLLLL